MKVLLFMVSLSIVLFTSLFHIFSQVEWVDTAEANSLPDGEVVIVEEGDSLWRLADRYNEAYGMDLYEMTDKMIEENRLKSAYIYPGQALRLPTKQSSGR